ncbi:MAG: NAD-dependent epimerase/dehydratase family protein, partial [Actinobacteria bacterium]|nr:NAD-dependent epimerase/dehydratase family protein [Actinomycetota bacterium]
LMNVNQTSRNRLRLTAERFGNSRSFHSITSTTQFVLDVLAWVLAVTIALVMRSYLQAAPDISKIVKDTLIRVLPMVSVVQAVTGYIVGIYRRRWRYGSFDEVKGLILSALITTIILWVIRFFDTSVDAFPRSAIVAGGILGLFFTAASRYSWRLIREQLRRPSAQNSTKLIIYGAGEGGIQIVNTMLRNPNSQYLPVAFLDDNPKTHRLRISGVPVLGGRNEIAKVTQRTGASTLLIAIPSADSTVVNEIVEIARESKLNVKILPVVQSLDERQVGAEDIRDLTDEDLLGRRRVKINLDEISDYLVNRRVLVTGAGGSIGSELCRQLVRFNPSEIIMLDRDESALHEVQLSIYGRALLDTPQTVLADLRDERAINEVFDSRKPQVVFHAAALKHLPLLERYPHEAYQTNVLGTATVLNAAQRTGVEVFVNISTDKAANPISVLGFSKKIAERLTADVASRTNQGKYISVRFGNVLGSRGSVLMSFRDQIAKGGPVTVTHRGVTRYFMTISEAVQLVVQAGAIGRTGEILVLDMGKPVNIHDVAEQLVKNSGKPIKIEVVGLRVGEKVHEELFAEGETDERPRHPLISHVAAKPINQQSLTINPTDSRELMIKLTQEK